MRTSKFKEGDLVMYYHNTKLIRGVVEMECEQNDYPLKPLPPINGSSIRYIVKIPSKVWKGYVIWYKNVYVREDSLTIDIQSIRDKRLKKILNG
jgi:hypothetical protein